MSDSDERRRSQRGQPEPPRDRSKDGHGHADPEVVSEIRAYDDAPWSENDIAYEMQRVEQLLDDEVHKLKSFGTQKARSQNQLDLARARSLLVCKRDHKDMSSDKLREAWVINHPVDDADVGALMLQADLDSVLYWDQHTTVKARFAQLDVLRSMLASAREHREHGRR